MHQLDALHAHQRRGEDREEGAEENQEGKPRQAGEKDDRERNPGDRGDLVEFSFDKTTKRLTIEETWLSGRNVYSKP